MPIDESGKEKGASRAYIMRAVEASLKRLKTDWLDLYQQHRPDPLTPIDETLRALDDLIRQGKVRYIGNSNFASWQLADADWTSRQLGTHRFVSAQDELSLVFRKAELEQLAACARFGLGFLPFFPLASGLLTGKHRSGTAAEGSRLANMRGLADRYLTPSNVATVERLRGWCDKRGMSLTELAFAWLLAKPSVSSVIAGATRAEQVEENAKSGAAKLSAEDVREVNALLDPLPYTV
jgi:aryl-alcohol dehydrogenase-like predicted oxidoreductase